MGKRRMIYKRGPGVFSDLEGKAKPVDLKLFRCCNYFD